MATTSFNCKRIYKSIMAGANNIIENSETLNEANGFPVPDSDTGYNLSYLMDYISRKVSLSDRISQLMENLSNAAISGARGNSGAIFSQFFTGFKSKSPDAELIESTSLVDCFKSGYEYAYKAISNPVEGTILTAMRSFAESLETYSNSEVDFQTSMDKAFTNLNATVAETKNTLKAQIDLKSEDAGALAFMYFIKGFKDNLFHKDGEKKEILDTVKIPKFKNVEEVYEQDLTFKFCTEILVNKNQDVNRSKLNEILNSYGDSVVISENESLLRVHVHTNAPDQVTKTMSKLGRIIETKADNMVMQQNLSKSHKGKIALVIDSIADLPQDFLSEDTYQLPMNLIADNVTYQDKRTVYNDLLKSKNVSSAQLTREQVEQFLLPIFDRYDQVLVITVSSKMSGIYDRYKEIQRDYPNKIKIIDSKQNSVAQGLLVNQAIELLNKDSSIDQIINEIENIIPRSKIYVSLPNLDAMVKSGRLNEKLGWLLRKLGFLPLVTINEKGQGKIEGKAFSQESNEKLFYKILEDKKDLIEQYALVHVNCPDRVKETGHRLTSLLGKPPLYIDKASSIIGNFSGDGSIAIGYILKES